MSSSSGKSLSRRLPSVDDERGTVGRLAAGAGVTLIGKTMGRGLELLKQVALARLLGPEIFGLYAIAWNLFTVVVTIVQLGLPHGLTRFAAHYWRREDGAFKGVVVFSLGVTLISSLVATGLLLLAASWLAVSVFKEPELVEAIRLFALGIPLLAGLRLVAVGTRVSQRMRYAVFAEEIVQMLFNLLLFLVFYLIGWQLFGAVLATVLSFAPALALAIYYLVRLFPELLTVRMQTRVTLGQLMTFSLPTAVSGMFGMLVGRLDRIFLGYFRPAAEVGIYQAAAQLSMLFATVVLGSFNAILTPMIADLHQQSEMERLQELYRVTTKWTLYVSLPLFLIVAFASHEIMYIVFGEQYVDGALPLLVLSAGQLFNAATGAVGFLLVMTGRQNRWFVISTVMLIFLVLLNWAFIPAIGSLGAALSTTLTVSMLYLIGLHQVRTQIRLWPYDRRYVKGLLAAASTVGALFLLHALPALSPLPTLLLTTATSFVTFIGALLLLGPDEEDHELMRVFRARIGI